jgi:hypothetical protein
MVIYLAEGTKQPLSGVDVVEGFQYLLNSALR